MICDECLTAANDEGCFDYELQVELCKEIGGEIGDHTCESLEDPDPECVCECACNKEGCI